MLCGCATSRLHQALGQRTESYVLAKGCADVWPTVKQVLEDRRFPGYPKGDRPYHLETAMLTASGDAPGAETTAGDRQPMRGRGGAAAAQAHGGSMRSGPVDHPGSQVMRFVVDGEAVDDAHCRVRVVRFARDNIDSAESDIDRDPEMEFEIISRLEPEHAEAMRKELAAQGIELPQ
jgi:hypothetical protein